MKKLSMLLVCLLACGHGAVRATQGGEGPFDEHLQWQEAKVSLTSARTFLHAATTEVSADPTVETLAKGIQGCNALIMTMHTQNILDSAIVAPRNLEHLVEAVGSTRSLYTAQIPLTDVEALLQLRYSLAGHDGHSARFSKCLAHVNNARLNPVFFAADNLVQQTLFRQVSGLLYQHHDMHAAQGWALVEKMTKSQVSGESLYSLFWSLPKPLQTLLIDTKGDKEHPQWRVLPEMAAPSTYTNTPWDRICRVEGAQLSNMLAGLEETHTRVMEAVCQHPNVRSALRAFDICDDYQQVYDEVMAFYWAVEKALVDIMPDGMDEQDTPYQRLLATWANPLDGRVDGPRELLTKTFKALLVRRLGLTHFFYLQSFHPSLFPVREEAGTHTLSTNVIRPVPLRNQRF